MPSFHYGLQVMSDWPLIQPESVDWVQLYRVLQPAYSGSTRSSQARRVRITAIRLEWCLHYTVGLEDGMQKETWQLQTLGLP